MQESTPKKISKKKERKPKPPKKITENYLHNSGLYYLQRFAASSGQFHAVMKRKIDKSCMYHKEQDKEKCMEMLSGLVRKFEDLGLLNDQAYTQAMITSLRRRGLSTRAILTKMKSKGINNDLVMEKLAVYDEENAAEDYAPDIIAALRTARKKRIGPFRRPDAVEKENEYEKALASLARAGFSYDIAKTAIDMDKDAAEQLIF